MLDLHTNEHGYTEINPPLLVKDAAMYGTGQLPKFRPDQFLASWEIDWSDVNSVLAAQSDHQSMIGTNFIRQRFGNWRRKLSE